MTALGRLIAARIAAEGPMRLDRYMALCLTHPRARALARGRTGAALEVVVAEHRRLTHPEEMGNLLQVLALQPEDVPPPPGFEA